MALAQLATLCALEVCLEILDLPKGQEIYGKFLVGPFTDAKTVEAYQNSLHAQMHRTEGNKVFQVDCLASVPRT